jgi:archaellum component FlaF (FlaF/FlaG flagellin family)
MKKIFFTILVAVMTLTAAQAGPEKKGNHKDVATEQKVETSEQKEANEPSINGEETYVTDKVKITSDGIVVKDDEGNDVRVNINDLNRIINEHLDDTVLSDAYNPIEIGSENVNAMANRGMDLAEDISRAFFTAIVCIVFFSLLFYYLHRRRKYKTVDRAIQAGYPLPDEFFGKRSQHVPQQPTTVYVTQVTPPEPNPNAPYDAQTAPGAVPPAYGQSNNPLNNITDWAPFKKGFRITAWGLGLLLFFWIVGATPVAALMIIVVFIGLGKLFVAYQEQQNLKNQWQQQQWTQQPQQNSQQQWQQWNPQQQPNNVPPMPETPPEFDPNK